MKLHIQVGLMMIWCSRSAALVPECTGKPSSLRWQSRRPPGMELCCTKQERMSLRNNIKRAAQTSWKFAYSLSIKLTKAIGVFLGDSFGHHASLIDVFQRSQRVSFFSERRFLLILISVFRLTASFSFAWAKAGRAGRYADGPAGQVIDYLMESGALDSPGTGLVPTKLDWGEALASSRHLLRRRSKLHMRDGSVQQVGLRGSHGISGAQIWSKRAKVWVKADPSFTDSDHLWSFTVCGFFRIFRKLVVFQAVEVAAGAVTESWTHSLPNVRADTSVGELGNTILP
jgi:hypothetical protein